MNYLDMDLDEIRRIANNGGSKKVELNKQISNHLHSLDLSDKASRIIASTDLNVMSEIFSGLYTKEDVEDFINENYEDDEL